MNTNDQPVPAAGSDTPLCDGYCGWEARCNYPKYVPTVPAEFARQLERELATALADNAALREEVAYLRGEVVRTHAQWGKTEAQLATAQADNAALRLEVAKANMIAESRHELNVALFSDAATAQAKISALESGLAELEQDKARLDWLEASGSGVNFGPVYHAGEAHCWKPVEKAHKGNPTHFYAATYRAAIDSARKEGQQSNNPT